MNEHNSYARRLLVKSSVLGLLAAAVPNIVYSKNILGFTPEIFRPDPSPHNRYPAIQLEIVSEVVGSAHFKLDRLKELVDPRPELAKAVWDWGYGDWESAIAAASHVGRRDIVEYLMSKGALPTIFSFAMLGDYKTVRSLVESYPGIQRNPGPHGISLLQHAKTGLEAAGSNRSDSQQLISYLQSLGDADGPQYKSIEEAEKTKYLGEYKYGVGKDDGFSIRLNMRKMLSLGKTGKNGGALLRIGENEFTYQGAPSVTVKFLVQSGRVISLTVKEPGLILTATKV